MKLGFIDYYLDEWHANNYPNWIREASGGSCEVAYAYGQISSPFTGVTSGQWCESNGVILCDSIEELIEKSDGIIVLSPDNCEKHEELCQLPLRSGKRVYVDKTFAPDLPAAKRIFAIAEENDTPCYSTSALRFAEEYMTVDRSAITAVNCWGPNDFETYSIHQLEPMMMLMGTAAKRVLFTPGEGCYQMLVDFEDGRFGSISGYQGGSPFMANIALHAGAQLINVQSDFFHNFIFELVDFFQNGTIKVSHEETLRIMAVRGAGLQAAESPGKWINVES